MNRSKNKTNINKKKIIVVISEDSKSSYYYLDSFRKQHRVNFILKKSNTKTDIKNLYKIIKKENADEYYIIIDKEDCNVGEVKSYNDKHKGANLIFSLPCFEYFVYLHYGKSDRQFKDWQEIADCLKSEFDVDYNKSDRQFFENLTKDFHKINLNYSFMEYKHPSTKIPQFLSKIIEYKNQELL
ncbi:MAG: RloB family protein [Alphaproteobacteria bacterium]|nr:RloB family protein [Alphaproteobacteria bacterium]